MFFLDSPIWVVMIKTLDMRAVDQHGFLTTCHAAAYTNVGKENVETSRFPRIQERFFRASEYDHHRRRGSWYHGHLVALQHCLCWNACAERPTKRWLANGCFRLWFSRHAGEFLVAVTEGEPARLRASICAAQVQLVEKART